MKLSDLIGKPAPWLAAACAGPPGLSATALRVVALSVGSDATDADAIAAAVIAASAHQIAALRQADSEFAERMRELGLHEVAELSALASAGREDARSLRLAARSIMPALLTSVVVVSFVVTLATLFWRIIPDGNRDLVVYMVGQLSGAFVGALAFWLGTTRHSEDKTRMLAQVRPPAADPAPAR